MDLRRAGGAVVMTSGLVGLAMAAFMLLSGLPTSPGGETWVQALSLLGFALLVLPIPLALVLVGRRLAFPAAPGFEPPRARAPLPPMPVPPPEAVADLPQPVTACPACGFLGIRMPEIGDGLWPGGGELGNRQVCPRCGYQGVAASFPTGEAYRAFLQELAAR